MGALLARPRQGGLPAHVVHTTRSRSRTSRSPGSSCSNTSSTSNLVRTAKLRPSRSTSTGMLATPPVASQTASRVTATSRVSRPVPCRAGAGKSRARPRAACAGLPVWPADGPAVEAAVPRGRGPAGRRAGRPGRAGPGRSSPPPSRAPSASRGGRPGSHVLGLLQGRGTHLLDQRRVADHGDNVVGEEFEVLGRGEEPVDAVGDCSRGPYLMS